MEHTLCARHQAKAVCIISFNLHKIPMRQVLPISQIKKVSLGEV